MIAFIALALALRARGARRSELGAWVGTGLLLPFYGAETFGLHAIGTHATISGADDLWQLADGVRNQPVALACFALGLLALAAVGVGVAVSSWRSGAVTRIAAIIVAAGLVTYLPQYFLPETGRVIHGVALGIGLLLLAAAPARAARTPSPAPEAIPRPIGPEVGENGPNRTVERTNHG
ncbi:hypothetical protein F8O04_09905 [Pseudoclavibacter endophyticus]|uniref:DUF998 domain-containing protein n=2 Tax=Pseudoclavibacter endophyticus TaxID=1778590 RepID=A0A6H9WJY4_9MICO|nr:hypothetical protein F8O04_09905 [Pseudoclavibacter endophyticus]